MKTCPRCKKSKQITDFYKSKHTKDGRHVYCADCSKAIKKLSDHKNIKKKGSNFKIPDSKVCSRCKKVKSSDNFVKNERSGDGLWWYCKSCDAEYRKIDYKKKAARRAATKKV